MSSSSRCAAAQTSSARTMASSVVAVSPSSQAAPITLRMATAMTPTGLATWQSLASRAPWAASLRAPWLPEVEELWLWGSWVGESCAGDRAWHGRAARGGRWRQSPDGAHGPGKAVTGPNGRPATAGPGSSGTEALAGPACGADHVGERLDHLGPAAGLE